VKNPGFLVIFCKIHKTQQFINNIKPYILHMTNRDSSRRGGIFWGVLEFLAELLEALFAFLKD
jgi:hypothetical protein